MEPAELRAIAVQEAAELGPEPPYEEDYEQWLERRRLAVTFLAGLARSDSHLCRHAAELENDRFVRELLIYAAEECSDEGPN